MQMLWEAIRNQYKRIYNFFGKNDSGIDMIFDLPFTFLMRNVSGRAMLPDPTELYIS